MVHGQRLHLATVWPQALLSQDSLHNVDTATVDSEIQNIKAVEQTDHEHVSDAFLVLYIVLGDHATAWDARSAVGYIQYCLQHLSHKPVCQKCCTV